MADLPDDLDVTTRAGSPPSPWATWLTLAWILAVLLAAVAVAFDLENLELALDFQRNIL